MRQILLIGISFTLISRAIISDSYNYSFAFPLPEDYRISILLDPCRLLAYNCCVNVFGKSQWNVIILYYTKIYSIMLCYVMRGD